MPKRRAIAPTETSCCTGSRGGSVVICMIQAERLRVVYGSVVAVDELSFTARPGEIFGLLGPNGAGKTTCIHCISGLLKPTAGRVVVTGALGVVPQEIALYDDLSATENLSYWGGAHRLRGRALRDRVREVTGGHRTRRSRARACRTIQRGNEAPAQFCVRHRAPNPRCCCSMSRRRGVDPQSRVRLLEFTRDLAREGRDRALHHALHGRSRVAVRPGGDCRPRPHSR